MVCTAFQARLTQLFMQEKGTIHPRDQINNINVLVALITIKSGNPIVRLARLVTIAILQD